MPRPVHENQSEIGFQPLAIHRHGIPQIAARPVDKDQRRASIIIGWSGIDKMKLRTLDAGGRSYRRKLSFDLARIHDRPTPKTRKPKRNYDDSKFDHEGVPTRLINERPWVTWGMGDKLHRLAG